MVALSGVAMVASERVESQTTQITTCFLYGGSLARQTWAVMMSSPNCHPIRCGSGQLVLAAVNTAEEGSRQTNREQQQVVCCGCGCGRRRLALCQPIGAKTDAQQETKLQEMRRGVGSNRRNEKRRHRRGKNTTLMNAEQVNSTCTSNSRGNRKWARAVEHHTVCNSSSSGQW